MSGDYPSEPRADGAQTWFTSVGDEVVYARAYDAKLAENARLREGIKKWASECSGCAGTGVGRTVHSVQGGEIMEHDLACEECADILALLELVPNSNVGQT